MSDEHPYYRLYLKGDEVWVVCMQWLDEHDYDQAMFASPEKYPTEEAANRERDRILWLADYLQKEP